MAAWGESHPVYAITFQNSPEHQFVPGDDRHNRHVSGTQ